MGNAIKRHGLLVGFFAVIIPLFIILSVQYWSLYNLETTSTVARKVWIKGALADIAYEVKSYYRTNAERVLAVPPAAFTENCLGEVKHHFEKNRMKGAKFFFVASFVCEEGAQILFYDPMCRSISPHPNSPEARAVNVACAPWKALSEDGGTVEAAGLTVEERDPDNRMIFKPIVDEASRPVGVAGFILDEAYFKNTLLANAIRDGLPKLFADDQDNVIITARDQRGALMLASQPVKVEKDELWVNLPFVFADWKLGIQSRDMTSEQWARWNFNVSLSLSILMTAVLIGGMSFALRTASREMKLSQMKTDFVSNVSHELRTPLSSIRVFGEFQKLGRVREPEKIQEYGEYIETESRRLTQLINNILDFSKIESGARSFRFQRADVGEVVAETLKTFEVCLRQSGIDVHFERPPAPLPPVLIDADAVTQALVNLLDNAVKYSGSSTRIDVRLGASAGFVTVAVRDHGIGMPREEIKKIFEKFYRVSTGLVHDVKGSGLGLAIVKHIVEAHGGRVTVESEPERGSTFTIHLPVAAAESVRAPGRVTQPALDRDPALGLPSKR